MMLRKHPASARPRVDEAQADRFLRALRNVLDGGPLPLEVWQTFDDKKTRDNPARRELISKRRGTLGQLGAVFSQMNSRGAGVFVQYNRSTDRGADFVTDASAIIFDDDNSDGRSVDLDALALPPTIVVATSPVTHPQKKHIYYCLVPGESLNGRDELQVLLQQKLDTDPQAVDRSRVLRVPGFLHCKGTPQRTELVVCEPARRYTLAQLREAFGVAHDATAVSRAKSSRRSRTKAHGEVKLGLLGILLETRGHLGDEHDGGRRVELCPNHAEHTTADDGTGTLYYPPQTTSQSLGFIHCFKAHCKDLTPQEWLARFSDEERRRAEAALIASQIDGGGLPVVRIDTDEHRMASEALRAVAQHPSLYARMGALVEVISDPNEHAARFSRVSAWRLRELLTEVVHFASWNDRKQKWTRRTPPEAVAQEILARRTWPEVRMLDALSSTPVLLGDGRVVSAPGYDHASRIFIVPTALATVQPDRVTQDDARAAVAALLELVGDFPFASGLHRAAWLGGLLTVISRQAFIGPAPLVLIDASTRGSGKSLLADVIACIALGRDMSRTIATVDDAEMRKKITTSVRSGDTEILFDNIVGALGTSALDSALTSTMWKDRILSKTENVEAPIKITFLATGNNVALAGDLSRRVLHIRLEPNEEHPEKRDGFKHDDLLGHVRANRARYFSDALSILRGYIQAGKPTHALPRWGSFEGWSALVREALVWAGQPDIGLTRIELEEAADAGTSDLHEILAGLAVAFGEMDGGRGTAAGLLEHLSAVDTSADELSFAPRYGHLLSLLGSACGLAPNKPLDAGRLGRFFARSRDRVVGGYKLSRDAQKSMHGVVWRVVAAAHQTASR